MGHLYHGELLVITSLGKNWSSFPQAAGQVPDSAAAECGTSPGNAAESAAVAAAAWPLGSREFQGLKKLGAGG